MAVTTFNISDSSGLLDDDSLTVVTKCLTAVTQALTVTELTKNDWKLTKVGIDSIKDEETNKYVDKTTYDLYCFIGEIRIYLQIEVIENTSVIDIKIYVGPYFNLRDYFSRNNNSIYFTLQLSNGYQIITDKPLMYKRAIKILDL